MRTYGLWAACGAGGGAAATLVVLLPLGVTGPDAVPLAVGALIGAGLGVFTGDGSIKREWAGAVGATVIPAVAVGLLSALLLGVPH